MLCGVVSAISATVDIGPDVLALDSNGEWIVAYIELPKGYDVNKIDIGTVKLNGVVPAETRPTAINDYDHDGIPDLAVKFRRASVQKVLLSSPDVIDLVVNITVTGKTAGTLFEGTEVVRVLKPKEATFVLSNLLIDPNKTMPREPVKLAVNITNIGEKDGTHTVTLKINETIEASKDTFVEATRMNEKPLTDTVTFTVAKKNPGAYKVEVDGLTESFRVLPPPEFEPTPIDDHIAHITVAGVSNEVTFNLNNDFLGLPAFTLPKEDSLIIELDEVHLISTLDIGSWPPLVPYDFVVSASLDGAIWYTVATVEANQLVRNDDLYTVRVWEKSVFPDGGNYQKVSSQRFDFAVPFAAKYLRVGNIIRAWNLVQSTETNMIAINEIDLYGA